MEGSGALRLTKQEHLTQGYITAGDRAYLIGAQDGGFPDLGWHVPGEMGGLWAHPVKLLDGFWLAVDGVWLTGATRFASGPFWSEHEYRLGDLSVVRWQFVPDGEPALIVRYVLRGAAGRTVRLQFLARSDLQGVWLADQLGLTDGADRAAFDPARQAWVIRDERNPWTVVVGARGLAPRAHACGEDLWGPERTEGRGISVALDYDLALAADGEAAIDFVVAGSHEGAEAACAAFDRAVRDPEAHWAAKRGRYGRLLRMSRLQVPDAAVQRAWDWIKCNYDWLVRDVPGLGRFLGAGAPDYMWLFGCDSAYAVLGCLALGQHELAVETLDALRRVSWQANGESGRVIHEATPLGHVYHRGNVQETPQYVNAVWQTFLWTGDMDFLRRSYPFCRQGLLGWVMGERCAPGEALPRGSGMMEVEGLDLQMIDAAAYTAQALEALAGMAEAVGDAETAGRSRRLREAVCRRLDEAFWIEEEGMYGDLLATPGEIAPRLRALVVRSVRSQYVDHARPDVRAAYAHLLARAEADPNPDARRPWLLKNWIVITPLEAGLAPAERASRVLARVESSEFTGPWGMYLNGIERAAAMSINTGVLAVAELNYGRPDEALARVRVLAETLERHMPGAVPEILPDGGCFLQAWSGYAIAWPVVSQVFGLQPRAHERTLLLRPRFPAGWPRASLRDVRVGTNRFDLEWDGAVLTVTSREPGWAVEAEGVPLHMTAGRQACE